MPSNLGLNKNSTNFQFSSFIIVAMQTGGHASFTLANLSPEIQETKTLVKQHYGRAIFLKLYKYTFFFVSKQM